MSEVGVGDGEGFSININMPGDAGDFAYRQAWEEVIQPAAHRFRPDIILVSAGALISLKSCDLSRLKGR